MEENMICVDFHDESEVLYITIGEPRRATAEELGNDTLLFHELETDEVVGVDVLSLGGPVDEHVDYDTNADTFVITIAEGQPVERREVAPNLVINFDQNSDPLTVEILNASRVLELEGSLKLKVSL